MNAHINIAQIVIDILLILVSFCVAELIFNYLRGFTVITNHLWMLVIFGIVFILSMFFMRMYDVTTFQYFDRQIQRTITSTLLATFSISTVVFFSKLAYTSRLFFIIFASFCFVLTLGMRIIKRALHSTQFGNKYTHILFIGSEEIANQYLYYIDKTDIKIKIDRRVDFDAPELKNENEFEKLLVELNISEIVIVQSVKMDSHKDISMVLKTSEDMGITAKLLLDFYELPNSKRFISNIGTMPILTYHSTSLDSVQLFYKSLLDIFGALVGLILFAPVFILTAIAIRIESPGPVVFCQTRVGRNGKKFKMYKFRSMYQDAEERKAELQAQNKIKGGFMFKMDNDPRITKVGKFIRKTSIDELPQLINVLMRDMSLVGTRPPTVDEVAKYERHHHRRISIMPGITGMWQVSGRSNIHDFEQVVELDKQYIEQWTIFLDIKLILQTVAAVIARKGAS